MQKYLTNLHYIHRIDSYVTLLDVTFYIVEHIFDDTHSKVNVIHNSNTERSAMQKILKLILEFKTIEHLSKV